jgi:hypothetical protein
VTSEAPRIGREALDLLLAVLELPTFALSATAVEELHPEAAAALQAAGLLHAEGHEESVPSAADHDDGPVSVTWCPDQGGYGIFTATAGWTAIPEQRLTRYVVRPEEVMARAAAGLRRAAGSIASCILPGTIWNLGEVQLPGRTHHVPLWFVRRLAHDGGWQQFTAAIRARPPAHQRLVLTSTSLDRLPGPLVPRHTVVSLHDIFAGQDDLRIAPEILADRLDGTSMAVAGGQLQVFGDGREVRFRGEVFSFPKGDTQRRVIMLLYDACLKGETKVPSSRIITELDLGPSTRLRDVFKRHPAWGRLLSEAAGMCGFCL